LCHEHWLNMVGELTYWAQRCHEVACSGTTLNRLIETHWSISIEDVCWCVNLIPISKVISSRINVRLIARVLAVSIEISPIDHVRAREIGISVRLALADHIWNVGRSRLEPIDCSTAVCWALNFWMVSLSMVVMLLIIVMRGMLAFTSKMLLG
jgi:hypothetical protein